jgi:hypothetical protein
MLAAFNVTALSDFGYNETTRFIDPMEPRYRPVSFSDADYKNRAGPFSEQGIKDKLDFFIKLDAYNKVDEVEKALAEYWSTHTGPAAGPATKAGSSKTEDKRKPTSGTGSNPTNNDNKSTTTGDAEKTSVTPPTPTTFKTRTTTDDKKGKATTTTKK